MTFDLLALLGSATLIGCAVQFVRQLFGVERLKWLPIASMLLCLLPVSGLLLGYWVHSFTGFLSIPLIALLIGYVANPLVQLSDAQQLRFQKLQHRYWLLMLSVGGFYFPMSLGLGSFDPHSLGWQPAFVWIPIAISLALVLIEDYWLAGLVFLSMLGWQLNILGASNGWNYFIDPIAVGFSAAGLVASSISKLWNRDRVTLPSENFASTSYGKAA